MSLRMPKLRRLRRLAHSAHCAASFDSGATGDIYLRGEGDVRSEYLEAPCTLIAKPLSGVPGTDGAGEQHSVAADWDGRREMRAEPPSDARQFDPAVARAELVGSRT